VLRDFAPGLLLLSADRRRRVQALTAWAVALFDLAVRPGLASLDGDRLAQTNVWEFRTEEALDGRPPGQPIFVAMACEEAEHLWPREALDRLFTEARRVALKGGDLKVGSILLEALWGTDETRAAVALAPLLDVPIALATVGELKSEMWPVWTESVQVVATAQAPAGWKRAMSFSKQALLRFLSRDSQGISTELGLGERLRLLAQSLTGPR
jgi:hypothetical protein